MERSLRVTREEKLFFKRLPLVVDLGLVNFEPDVHVVA